MKVIVCGGRDFKSQAQVWRELDRLHAEVGITELMQGGARGVDTFAAEWAATNTPLGSRTEVGLHGVWEARRQHQFAPAKME